jgi:predicted ester cyclase
MDTVELIAEGDTVIGRFTCSATHTGTWLGHPPTGRRFTNINEVNLYRFHHGKIADTWTLEDNLERLNQLGLLPPTGPAS